MQMESLKERIVKKAWDDPAFKKSLLSEPKKAIKEAFGVVFPAAIQLKVVEESASLCYLTLGPKPEDVERGEAGPNLIW